MVSSTTPRLEARCPPVRATLRTIISRSCAAIAGSFSRGTFFRSAGDPISDSRGISGTLGPPRLHHPDQFPQWLALRAEDREGPERLPPELPRAGHRRSHAECHWVGPFPPCAVLRRPLPHLLE